MPLQIEILATPLFFLDGTF